MSVGVSGKIFLTGCVAAAIAMPALAQSDPAQPAPATPNPGTTAANQAVEATIDATAAMNAEGQAQYDGDRASYLEALARHNAAVDRTDARYARQQRAYADAMAVWRWQVDRCRKGHQRACDLPTPNVADYY